MGNELCDCAALDRPSSGINLHRFLASVSLESFVACFLSVSAQASQQAIALSRAGSLRSLCQGTSRAVLCCLAFLCL